MKSNIEALKIHLTDKQIEYIEGVQNFDIGFPGNFVGDDPRAGLTAPIISAAAPVVWAVSSFSLIVDMILLTMVCRNSASRLAMTRLSMSMRISNEIR